MAHGHQIESAKVKGREGERATYLYMYADKVFRKRESLWATEKKEVIFSLLAQLLILLVR